MGGCAMKIAVRFLSAALVVAATSVPAAYVFENFNGVSGNAPGSSGWLMPSGVYITNSPAPSFEGGSLYVPVNKVVSNQITCGVATKIWTDFYTIPRPFISDVGTAPAIDTNATALFFVNSDGIWQTISGNGSGGYLTNTCSQVLGVEGAYPTVTQNNVFYHISVLHDYTVTPARWSLFVNDLALATNLYAISTIASQHEWFQVQNFGGSETNICYLDEFLVTNKVPPTIGSTNNVPGTDVPQSVAITYFDTFASPLPVTTNFDSAGGDAVVMQLDVETNQQYILIAGANPTGTMTTAATLNTGAGAVGSISDPSALSGGRTKRFYKVIRVSSVDASVSVTNQTVYGVYKQTRLAGYTQWIGVPLDYGSTENTLAGRLGQDLAQGLVEGDVTSGDTLTIYQGATTHQFYLDDTTHGWVGISGSDPAGIHLTPGMGVMIKSVNGTAGSSIFAGNVPTNASVQLATGYNSIAWPFENAGFSSWNVTGATSNNNSTLASGDILFVWKDGQPYGAKLTSSGWYQNLKTAKTNYSTPLSNISLQAGDGVLYKLQGASGTWAPVAP